MKTSGAPLPTTEISMPIIGTANHVKIGHTLPQAFVTITIGNESAKLETETLLKHLAALCHCYVLPKEIKGRVVNG